MSKFSDRVLFFIAEHIFPLALKILGATWRIEIDGEEKMPVHGAAIYPIWHGHLLAHTYAFRDRGINVLVSRSRDGELIARALKKLGYGVVRGSSSRGGTKAILEMADILAGGGQVAITPDGPRGPAHRIKDGVVYLAKNTGAPVFPATVTCAGPAVRLNSWDRFMIPLPFAKVKIAVGGPLIFSKNSDPETIRQQIFSHMPPW
ncbi:lysophospholipid acyltransferase family protein [bacterium]|nr:lysophospholipid acyltransferase family protein [bacterium]